MVFKWRYGFLHCWNSSVNMVLIQTVDYAVKCLKICTPLPQIFWESGRKSKHFRNQRPSKSPTYLPELEHSVPPFTRVFFRSMILICWTDVSKDKRGIVFDSFLCEKLQMPAGRSGGTRPIQTPGKRPKHVPRTASGNTAERKGGAFGSEAFLSHLTHF